VASLTKQPIVSLVAAKEIIVTSGKDHVVPAATKESIEAGAVQETVIAPSARQVLRHAPRSRPPSHDVVPAPP
jgi:hypothetical protein